MEGLSQVKLIATDMDGTLISKGMGMSKENLAGWIRAVEAGKHVVLATGRPPWSAQEAISGQLGEMKLVNMGPGVYSNGSLVLNEKGEVIYEEPFSPEMFERVIDFCKKNGFLHGITVYTFGGIECAELSEGIRAVHAIHKEPLPTVVTSFTGKYYKINYSGSDQEIQNFNTALKSAIPELETACSIRGAIEVKYPHVNKATGLEMLCRNFGITSAQVAAIGDRENDLEMLQWAKYPFTVQNGIDPCKKIALKTLSSCDQHGFADLVDLILTKDHPVSRKH